MAQKITLTVPDHLYSEINRWRSAFNMSRIFQDAVAEAIRRKDEFQRRMQKEAPLAETIKRLRDEKSNWTERVERAARVEGEKWATHAHYEDLTVAAAARIDQIDAIPAVKDAINGTVERILPNAANAGAPTEENRQFIARGWLEGVQAFWKVVKDKI